MHWFLIALIGPILYACANHTDKYLISKYLEKGEVGALIIFASIFSVLALPVVLVIHPLVFNVGFLQGVILAINSMLVVLAVLLYFYALQQDEASVIVPFYQTIPIFAFVLSYFTLGETISYSQGFSTFVIIAGAIILSLELIEGKLRFKNKVVLLMLIASLLYAINVVVFKLIATEEGFWTSTFWGLIGKIILGFVFIAFVPKYRIQFLAMMKTNKGATLGLNSLSESLLIAGEGVTQYAILLAPVGLVMLVNSLQPFFVFVIGIAITLFFPKVGQESLTKRALLQKGFGIGLIILGSYFIGS